MYNVIVWRKLYDLFSGGCWLAVHLICIRRPTNFWWVVGGLLIMGTDFFIYVNTRIKYETMPI